MYKAVIFDLDGTLISSLADIADAVNHALSKNNYPTHDYGAYHNFVGEGVRNLIKNALPQNMPDAVIDNVLNDFINYYKNHLLDKTVMYDGIAAMLDTLKEKGFKIAVLSNKAHELTVSIVEKLFSKWNFDYVQGPTDKVKRKPDPQGALLIANQLNVNPEETILVGDSKFDIQTAKAAGMISVGVTWGFRKREELMAAQADFIIDKPSQLITIAQS